MTNNNAQQAWGAMGGNRTLYVILWGKRCVPRFGATEPQEIGCGGGCPSQPSTNWKVSKLWVLRELAVFSRGSLGSVGCGCQRVSTNGGAWSQPVISGSATNCFFENARAGSCYGMKLLKIKHTQQIMMVSLSEKWHCPKAHKFKKKTFANPENHIYVPASPKLPQWSRSLPQCGQLPWNSCASEALWPRPQGSGRQVPAHPPTVFICISKNVAS